MRARLAIVLALTCGLTACGHKNGFGHVSDYVAAVNAQEARAAPELARANGVFRQFSRGRLPSAAATAGLIRAQNAIAGLRASVARLPAPPKATTLRMLVLRVYSLDEAVAQESTQLALYLPAAQGAVRDLGPINAQLRRHLKTTQPGAQGRALDAYASALRRIITRLERLNPPPIMSAANATQLTRLRTAARLAEALRRATAQRDTALVARLLVRFQQVNGSGGSDRVLTNRQIRAYDARVGQIALATGDVQREEARLQRTLR